ncbi:MAG: YtxH domain-containing protein [Anaerolineales bacterium]
MRRMFGFLIGIFTGALVGGVIAVLLAPESGERLRGQLRDRGQNFLNDVRHSADARRIELRSHLESLRTSREDF